MASAAPAPFTGDQAITPDVLRSHKISAVEYAAIEKHLGRAPSYTELGVFSVMWSEHCSYKSSRVHLRRLPTKGPRVIQGPGENAGVVDIGDGFAAVFKMESHNHPSFIEPYQGAATGVGGILRDVFTMGARPIASLNSLRFGRPGSSAHAPSCCTASSQASAATATASACPPSAARVTSSTRTLRRQHAWSTHSPAASRAPIGFSTDGPAGIGNKILYIGAKTGRDGIHGATMASDEFAGAAEPSPRRPDDASRRSVHGQAAPRSVSRALLDRRARRHSRHGRGGPHLVVGRDGRARRQRHRARSRLASRAAPRTMLAVRNPP